MATIKQQRAIKVVVNGGSPTDGMREANYAPSVIRKPKVLTGSKGWQELMEKFIPDDLLARKHKELLEIPKRIRQFKKGELLSEYEELDSNAVSKGLDMGYKLKGKYQAEKVEHSGSIEQEIKADEETLKKINEFISWRKKEA